MTSLKKMEKLLGYLSNDDIRNPRNILIYGPNDEDNYDTFTKYIDGISYPNIIKRLRINLISGTDISIKRGTIHFELDLQMITNVKLWMEIYHHIRDIMVANKISNGIFLLQNFQRTNVDILESIFSLFDDKMVSFVILTRDITFINESIRKRFITLRTKSIRGYKLHQSYKMICDKIVKFIINIDDITYQDIRSNVYEILTYNLNHIECVTYIIDELIKGGHLSVCREFLDIVTKHINGMNKNYRSIYHLEGLFVYLILNVHGLRDIPS